MTTVQTNVRVHPEDQPLLRAVASRLRAEPHFRNRLKALLEEDPSGAAQHRLELLEERVAWLLGIVGQPRPSFRVAPAMPNGSRGPALTG